MYSRANAEVLRDIMRRVEQCADVAPDHPDVLELKRILLQKILAVEPGSTRASGLSAAGNPPSPSIDGN